MNAIVKPTSVATALLSILTACSASWNEVRRAPDFRPTGTAPIRIAVLPFEDKSGGTSALYYPLLPFIYLANLITFSIPDAPPDSAMGAATLQALMLARLGGTPIRVVSPRAVLTTLAHKGVLQKAPEMDPVELGRLLGVDAVLYGELLDWAGHYYVAESRTVVEARVRLVSTLDRRELFAATIGVTDRAGITGGPTGYIGAAATPVAALGTGPYNDLAHEWAEIATTDLLNANSGDGAVSSPVDPVPFIAASAVSPNRDVKGYHAGEIFEVVALGSPGCQAYFDVGNVRTRVPLVEASRAARNPDGTEVSAIYKGNFFVSSVDRANGVKVRVTFESNSGRVSADAEGEPVHILASPK